MHACVRAPPGCGHSAAASARVPGRGSAQGVGAAHLDQVHPKVAVGVGGLRHLAGLARGEAVREARDDLGHGLWGGQGGRGRRGSASTGRIAWLRRRAPCAERPALVTCARAAAHPPGWPAVAAAAAPPCRAHARTCASSPLSMRFRSVMDVLMASAWRSACAPRRPSLQCEMLHSVRRSCCTTCVRACASVRMHVSACV